MNNRGQDWFFFPEGLPSRLRTALRNGGSLIAQTGFSLFFLFRRRNLVPFTLVPKHVSDRYGSAEKLSLLTLLQEAHEAFVFGTPFAALALMRSVMETVLRDHYQAQGKDLNDYINDAENTPSSLRS